MRERNVAIFERFLYRIYSSSIYEFPYKGALQEKKNQLYKLSTDFMI